MKYFIEIGCNRYDTLIDLARLGWQGLMIDPLGAAACPEIRHENITFVDAAITEESGEFDFFVVDTNDDWSSLLESHHKKVDKNSSARKIRVRGISFNDLLKEHPYPRIDYLKIDTEGYDARIIRTIDFSLIDIQLISFEYFHMSDEEIDEIAMKLDQAGFRLSGAKALNLTFKKKEHEPIY